MAWQDTFTRANQSGWGTASDGETWAHPVGTATLSIASNEGNITGQSARNIMLLGSQSARNCEGIVRLSSGNGLDSGTGLILCSNSAGTNSYTGQIAGSTSLLIIAKTVAGASTTLASTAFTMVSSTFYWVKFRVNAGSLYLKVWASSGSEPSAWSLTIADSTYTSGQFGVRAFPSTVGTNAQFDNFQVYPVGQAIIGNHKAIGSIR